ncbi:MAG: S41 family peptidase [Anaerolineae bacterium]|jgi:carboxyl-terminal processing protease|nr:S41 family peptidase [Anaerolineae bacterium]
MKWINLHQAKLQVAVLLVVVFAAGFAFGAGGQRGSAQERLALGDLDQAFQPFWEVYDAIQTRYVDAGSVAVPELVDGAIRGMIESLGDEYSGYMDPQAYEMFNGDLSGGVEGIGVVIDTLEDSGDIVVVTVLEGAAAKAAGVLPGDIFWEVDGQSVQGLNQTDLAALVRGPAGTAVTIVFKRGEEFITFTITRVRFEVPTVESRIETGNVAYIKLMEFNAIARAAIDEALLEVDVNSRSGLIFDLRGNPGGLLSSAVDIGSLFVRDGVLLYEAFGDGTEQTFEANGTYGNINVPIVVLVDETSASASELVAGAVQDRGVATLIGEVTFGKGTVQTIQPLSNNGGLRLTIARWLTPNRNWIHEQGVTPDIIVEWTPTTAEDYAGPDPQLQAALEFLQNR